MAKMKIAGEKRCVRNSVSITKNFDKKLNLLATSCNMPPATLASIILQEALDNAEIVYKLQKEYNKNEQYWVRLMQENGVLKYIH